MNPLVNTHCIAREHIQAALPRTKSDNPNTRILRISQIFQNKNSNLGFGQATLQVLYLSSLTVFYEDVFNAGFADSVA